MSHTDSHADTLTDSRTDTLTDDDRAELEQLDALFCDAEDIADWLEIF